MVPLRRQIIFFVGGSAACWISNAVVTYLRRFEAFVPLLFCGGDGGVGPADEGLRLVFVPLLAKGMDLICSPVSFFFCVGGSVGGGRLLFQSLVSSSVMADRLLLFFDLDDDG